jgi:hypothetical protein
MPTGTGVPESGLFGCVRNSGTRFHEGIDLGPIARGPRGEAIDPIVSIADGVVRHISHRPGDGGYGRYVVVEHPDLVPAVYTLYGHLASIESGVGVGTPVRRGQKLGVMGHSAGGYVIPVERAHLHFEIGLRLSDNFDRWYREQGYGNPNRHGDFNGMNLVGFDPLAFFDAFRKGAVRQPLDFIATLPVAATVFIRDARTPDFARRYPMLVEGERPLGGVAGWEVDFSPFALPLRLRPVSRPPELAGARPSRFTVLRQDPAANSLRCQDILDAAKARRGSPAFVPGKDLRENLEILFGTD